MHIEKFEIMRMQCMYEKEVEFNLSETTVSPLRVSELLDGVNDVERFISNELTYPEPEGSQLFRERIAQFYVDCKPENIIVTNGGSEANYMTLWTLLEPGDRLACMIPNFMQAWGLGHAYADGVDAFFLVRQKEAGLYRWTLDLESLKRAVTPKTNVIVITNPNNPTGALLTPTEMDAVVDIANRAGAWLVVDEMYRGPEVDGGTTVMLADPDTGYPKAIVNASYLNGFRTAAADAIAVSFLARPDATVLGVIGAEHQAEQEIRAVAEVRALSLIKIHNRSEARFRWIADQLKDVDIDIRFTSAEDAVRGSDIVITVTPSEEPIVREEWIKEGTHISAMGADDRGKHELDAIIVKRASLFADYPKQSVIIGEFQHAYGDGFINSVADICALGLVTLGKSPGRTSDNQITFFDSSGIAIQDIAVADAIFKAAQKMDQIQYVDF